MTNYRKSAYLSLFIATNLCRILVASDIYYTNYINPENTVAIFDQKRTYAAPDASQTITSARGEFRIYPISHGSLYELKHIQTKNESEQTAYDWLSNALIPAKKNKACSIYVPFNVLKAPECKLFRWYQPAHTILYRHPKNNITFELFKNKLCMRPLNHNSLDHDHLFDLATSPTDFSIDIIDNASCYVIGIANFKAKSEEEVEISGLYVSASYRSKNLGSLAIKIIERFAAINNIQSITLNAKPFGVNRSNLDTLLKWYKSQGFEITNTSTNRCTKAIEGLPELPFNSLEIAFDG